MLELSRPMREQIDKRFKIQELIEKLLPDDYKIINLSGSIRINPCPFTGSNSNALSIYVDDRVDSYCLWSSNRLHPFEDLPDHGRASDILCCIAKTQEEVINLIKGRALIKRELKVRVEHHEHWDLDLLSFMQEEYLENLEENHMWFLTGVRKFTPETIEHFGVGYDYKTKAYSYPYIQDGKVRHFKYKMNHKDRNFVSALPNNSGGDYFFNEDALLDEVVVFVEGEHDAMMVWQRYKLECVALGGNFRRTSKRYDKMKKLENKIIYLAFDNDEAGKEYTEFFLKELSPSNKIFEVQYEGKDPDECIKSGKNMNFPVF